MQSRFSGLIVMAVFAAGLAAFAQEQRPTFRAGASRVSLNVVVKDGQGRPVMGLVPKDFQVFDEGRAVPFDNLGADVEGVSISLLIDTSGSMALGPRLAIARQAMEMLLGQFQSIDEIALLTFDKTLQQIVPFTSDLDRVRRGFDRVKPFGATSLHDAAAAAARELGDRRSLRRAVVAVTDGHDNSSELTAAAASRIASLIDVPVYVLAVTPPDRVLDPSEVALEPVEGGRSARLDDLTGRTGGASFAAEAPGDAHLAARHILSDLRAGYLFGFTPSETPGWHRLTVRVTRKDVRVRTRDGFWMGARPF
ncbi:MAG TPA: VWA domain-containing protein [Vicinamibacterales bacterium]|nr:VWA domain-containing protein [Vicinamibacterales bacterium]